jgi:hypothetical protein
MLNQLSPLALYIQGLKPLATVQCQSWHQSETEGLIYATRLILKGGSKLFLFRNHSS